MQIEFVSVERQRVFPEGLVSPEPEGQIRPRVIGQIGIRPPGKEGSDWDEEALLDYMVTSVESEYDSRIAAFLSAASAWAYSDTDTFMRLLCNKRLSGQCVSLGLTNEALLVDTTAYFFQSTDKRLAVLVFRGTEPTNLLTWLMDASAKTEPLLAAGHVHGGFYRSILVLWPMIRRMLVAASRGVEIRKVYEDMTREGSACGSEVPFGPLDEAEAAGEQGEPRPRRSALEALYIGGHSLGGALAVLAAAGIYMDIRRRAMDPLRDVLRGIYTFGQPMLADRTLASALDERFGDKLFRHVYQNDIVPRLPPRTVGEFVPFGREYVSTDHGWMHSTKLVSQVFFMAWSTLIGGLAWVRDQLPFVRWLRLPLSWADHSPHHYLRTSQKGHAGLELML